MNKMCVAFLGVLLLALILSTEVVRAQNPTTAAMNTTMNYTMTTSDTVNTTNGAKNDCARSGSSALLLLLLPALGASLLHSWS